MDNLLVAGGFQDVFGQSFPVRAAAGFVLASLSLAAIGAATSAGYFDSIDATVREGASRTASAWLTEAMRIVTRLGSTIVLTIAGSAAVLVFAALKWRRAIGLFLLAMAGQIVLHHGFKALIARERPEALLGYQAGDSFSFPSGHALASLSVYGMLAWLMTNRVQRPGVNAAIWLGVSLLVLTIGFSRIYFGVHNATDVIAGWLAAVIWVWSVASGDTEPEPRTRMRIRPDRSRD